MKGLLDKDNLPREKALKYGFDSLSDVELIALLLRTGNKNENVMQLAFRLLDEIGGIEQLKNVDYATLSSMKGIKKAKAIQILSVVELSRRIKSSVKKDLLFSNPHDIYYYLKDDLMFLKQEHFIILCLDIKKRLIKRKTVFIGNLNSSIVTPREVFKEAIGVNSASIILIHNHPSGNCYPSDEDRHITSIFMQLGEMLDIEVLDHIIIGWNQFFSIIANQCFHDKN